MVKKYRFEDLVVFDDTSNRNALNDAMCVHVEEPNPLDSSKPLVKIPYLSKESHKQYRKDMLRFLHPDRFDIANHISQFSGLSESQKKDKLRGYLWLQKTLTGKGSGDMCIPSGEWVPRQESVKTKSSDSAGVDAEGYRVKTQKMNSYNKKKFECLRQVDNWGKILKEHRFDKSSFDHEKMMEDFPTASPKMQKLFDHIKALDNRDQRRHGKKFKHFIFSDVRSQGYGAKILTAGFISQGYHLAFNDKFKIDITPKQDKFAVLSSTSLYGKPFPQRLKKSLLSLYNGGPRARSDKEMYNVHGERLRFFIFDSGFKEGIDLFDVKYVHLFDTPLNDADRKQAVGRATRTCGQMGLKFIPNQGWPLHIYVYQNRLEHPEYQTVHNLLYSYSGVDLAKANTIAELSRVCHESAVDYELNEPVNYWSRRVEPEQPIMVPLLTDGTPVLPGVSRTNNTMMTIQNGGDPEINCQGRCGARPTKDIPFKVNLMRLIWVALGNRLTVIDQKAPNGKRHMRRSELCQQLSVKQNFCSAVTEVYLHPERLQKYERLAKMRIEFKRETRKKIKKNLKKSNKGRKNQQLEKIIEDAREEMRIVPYQNRDIVALDDSRSTSKSSIKSIQNRPLLLQQQLQESNSASSASSTNSTNSTKLLGAPPQPQPQHQKQSQLESSSQSLSQSSQTMDNAIPFVSETPLNMNELRARIRELYKATCTWDSPKFEDRCNKRGGDLKSLVRDYFPTQNFVRQYFNPGNPYGGMLLDHSVGTGKTCTAIATASTFFEPQGYHILWVTRTTLKADIWKDMFDSICNATLKNEVLAGKITSFPDALGRRRKLIGQRWLEPISYKQFSNALAGKNRLGKHLRDINGKSDPLRKTLVIIDEAHKLYGGTDLKGTEKADMKVVEKTIFNSYRRSGNNSGRLLIMTATPVANDPMEVIRLFNLMERDESKRFPVDYAKFQEQYLDINGLFRPETKAGFMDRVCGYVSYLNREGDPTNFSQPIYHTIKVDLAPSKSVDLKKGLEDCQQQFGNEVKKYQSELQQFIFEAKDQIRYLTLDQQAEISRLQHELSAAPRQDKASIRSFIAQTKRNHSNAKRELRQRHSSRKKQLQQSIVATKAQQRQCVRDIRQKAKESANNIDQTNMIRNRCKVSLS